jgi:hypothetical protein
LYFPSVSPGKCHNNTSIYITTASFHVLSNPLFTNHPIFDDIMSYWHVARMGEKRNAYRILVGKLEGRRPLGRPRRRRVDNIKMDLTKIGWDGMDWTDLTQDRDQ